MDLAGGWGSSVKVTLPLLLQNMLISQVFFNFIDNI